MIKNINLKQIKSFVALKIDKWTGIIYGMENGKILNLYDEKYWIFFLCKISITIICYKFSEKYIPTSKEVKKNQKFLI